MEPCNLQSTFVGLVRNAKKPYEAPVFISLDVSSESKGKGNPTPEAVNPGSGS